MSPEPSANGPSRAGYWQAWLERCEREALRCEREAARWRGEKADYARQQLNECDGQTVLL